MKIINTVKELRQQLKESEQTVSGLVPTMGALHKGHLSLVKNAIIKCPLVVVSIYVNPTQFNDPEDLIRYPRPIKKDLAVLSRYLRENDIVFNPDDKEMYPEEDTRSFSFGKLDNLMESLHRPGHFIGVARVVSKLFEITAPDYAFFGLKDFQQIAVVKELIRQNNYNIRIVSCPIVRETDGLAMSSRNILLGPKERKDAPVIFKTISEASEMIREYDIPEIKTYIINTIEKKPGFHVEYFEIVDDKTFISLNSKKEMKKGINYHGCIAVMAGKIRLIDNIEFPLA
jgi:pantoate--beta-alanine ligase